MPKKIGLALALLAACAAMGCSSQPSSPGSGSTAAHLTEGKLRLYLSGLSPSRTPDPGAVGYTDWGFQVNGFNKATSFIIYEGGYQGAFMLSSSCPSSPNAVATAQFSPDAMGPGAILVVTSGRVYSATTCVFSITDSFGQTIHLSVGYPA